MICRMGWFFNLAFMKVIWGYTLCKYHFTLHYSMVCVRFPTQQDSSEDMKVMVHGWRCKELFCWWRRKDSRRWNQDTNVKRDPIPSPWIQSNRAWWEMDSILTCLEPIHECMSERQIRLMSFVSDPLESGSNPNFGGIDPHTSLLHALRFWMLLNPFQFTYGATYMKVKSTLEKLTLRNEN